MTVRSLLMRARIIQKLCPYTQIHSFSLFIWLISLGIGLFRKKKIYIVNMYARRQNDCVAVKHHSESFQCVICWQFLALCLFLLVSLRSSTLLALFMPYTNIRHVYCCCSCCRFQIVCNVLAFIILVCSFSHFYVCISTRTKCETRTLCSIV